MEGFTRITVVLNSDRLSTPRKARGRYLLVLEQTTSVSTRATTSFCLQPERTRTKCETRIPSNEFPRRPKSVVKSPATLSDPKEVLQVCKPLKRKFSFKSRRDTSCVDSSPPPPRSQRDPESQQNPSFPTHFQSCYYCTGREGFQ